MLRWEHHLLANQEKLRAYGRCAEGETRRAGASSLHDLGGAAVSAARVAAGAHDELVRSTAVPLLRRAMSAPEIVVRSDAGGDGDGGASEGADTDSDDERVAAPAAELAAAAQATALKRRAAQRLGASSATLALGEGTLEGTLLKKSVRGEWLPR